MRVATEATRETLMRWKFGPYDKQAQRIGCIVVHYRIEGGER
jgi:hypothetical protein